MTINWTLYDALDHFEIFDAACLWLEEDPSQMDRDSPPSEVTAMMQALEYKLDSEAKSKAMTRKFFSKLFGNPHPPGLTYLRSKLIEIAESLGQQPLFLYPDLRSETEEKNQKKAIHKAAVDSHLILISGLLKELSIDATVRESTAKVQRILEKHGYKLDQKTIRKILGNLDTIPENRKPE